MSNTTAAKPPGQEMLLLAWSLSVQFLARTKAARAQELNEAVNVQFTQGSKAREQAEY